MEICRQMIDDLPVLCSAWDMALHIGASVAAASASTTGAITLV